MARFNGVLQQDFLLHFLLCFQRLFSFFNILFSGFKNRKKRKRVTAQLNVRRNSAEIQPRYLFVVLIM